MIKRFKPAYQLYNFFKRKQLAYNLPFYKKYSIRKRYFSSVSSKDFQHLNLVEPIISAEQLKTKLTFQQLDSSTQDALLQWPTNGFVLLKNFLSEEKADAVNQEIQHLIAQQKTKFRYGGKKIMFAFHISELISSIGNDTQLINILKLLTGKNVDLFQSINFIEPSEQRTHSDSIHMTTFPYGNIIAVWIALEDVGPEQGPLHYYPGSHQLPYIMNSDFGNEGSRFFLGEKSYADYEDKIEEVLAETQLNKQIFLAKKGDLFIWHANLLHGGEPLKNKDLTRKSMVFHYYADDAICFHEVTQRPTLKRANK